MKSFNFQFKPFILLNLLSVLLIFSWSFEFTREYWDYLDMLIFQITNLSLIQVDSLWSGLWAILSIRASDLIPLFIMVFLFYTDRSLFDKRDRLIGFIGFVVLLVLMLFVRELLDLYIEYTGLVRESPTLIMDSAIRLSEIYPAFNLKDASSDSFPGDHAAVLATWFGYCWFFMKNRGIWLYFSIALLFLMPRIMAGAHWFSDIFVGGLSIALITLAFGIYTPLLNGVSNKIEKTIGYILNKDNG